jgi:hypothetical protein
VRIPSEKCVSSLRSVVTIELWTVHDGQSTWSFLSCNVDDDAVRQRTLACRTFSFTIQLANSSRVHLRQASTQTSQHTDHLAFTLDLVNGFGLRSKNCSARLQEESERTLRSVLINRHQCIKVEGANDKENTNFEQLGWVCFLLLRAPVVYHSLTPSHPRKAF